MKEISVRGKIEFCEEENKEYDREFTAILTEVYMCTYGYKKCVKIKCVKIFWGTMKDGTLPARVIIDTRYDEFIRKNETDFKKWVQSYLEKNYDKHVLTFY